MSSYFISFRLGSDQFAVDVHKVREVLEPMPVTKVPLAPLYVMGVIDVRNVAIPIIDLRSKFGLAQTANTPISRILILELNIDGHECVIGGLADAVLEVLEFEDSQIDPAPSIGLKWKPDIFHGVGHRGSDLILLLDIEKAITADELRAVMQATQDTVDAGGL